MIAEDITLTDLDPAHWNNLIGLGRGKFSPPRKKSGKPPKTRLLLIWKGERCLKAIHNKKGVIRGFDFPGIDQLEQIKQREGVDSILAIEHGAPRKMMHRLQSGLSLDSNLVQQGLDTYAEIRKELELGGARSIPSPRLKDVRYSAISTVIKMVFPSNELVIFCLYSEDGKIKDSSGFPIITSGIHRFNKSSEMDLWTTTDSLVSAGLRVEDWKKDYKNINKLASKVWGDKVYLGLHIPLSAMLELSKVKPPKQPKLLQEFAKQKKLIIDPFPMRFKMVLKMGGLGR